MNIFRNIRNWFTSLLNVFRNEFGLVWGNVGVMLFFFALPVAYPVVYTLIYNPEVVRNIPVAVIDHSRTPESREWTRMVNATDGIEVYAISTTLDEARRLHRNHEVFGIMEIPADFDKCIARGEQANVTFYSDMGLLLRLRTFMINLTNAQMAECANIRNATIASLGAVAGSMSAPQVDQESVMIGDPTQGFASFIIPGIVVLILQQSMILGVTMLAGGASERRRKYGYDPKAVAAPASASVFGKALCYVMLYIPLTIYILDIVPAIFNLPHYGNMIHNLIFILPLLFGSAFLGMALGAFVKERESSFMVVVFTSVIFLFLSGLTWPRYAMSGFWKLCGDAIPCVWALEGFVRLNSNGASLAGESHCYAMMWLLAAIYFLAAMFLTRYLDKSLRVRSRLLS
ncbi:MAG: ABC transporter permease [Paramuribaculum sp.]|nr:ABC transporter permease [Paramuribaculum sp.]MDE6304165.1 ABC transporter permease [Paramuribaculum sp.]